VHLVEVDVVGAEALQAALDGADDVVAAEAEVVGAVEVPDLHAHLGGDQHVVTVRAQRSTEDLLGLAGGVDVRGVEEVHPGVAGERDLTAGTVHVEVADGLGPAGSGEAHGAEGDGRDAEPRGSQLAVVHPLNLDVGCLPRPGARSGRRAPRRRRCGPP
jgi:hypothetical protein